MIIINKIYEQIKKFLKQNYKIILFFIIFGLLINIKLPYYINVSGGLIDLNERIQIKNKKEPKGSFNLAYVNQLHATIPTYLYAKINNNWKIEKEKDLTFKNEEIKDAFMRDSILMDEATNNAINLAFIKANKPYKIKENNFYIIYVDPQAKTNLKVGDQILEIDKNKFITKDDLFNYVKNKEVNDQILLKVKNDDKVLNKKATIIKEENKPMVGIAIANVKELKTTPKIKLKFKDSELGSSGGLMTTLAVYNCLINKDITKGKKIVGTGTIDEFGNVGSIGGLKYKLNGAVKNKADLFLVPFGENYEESKKEKKKNHYKIKIVPIKTLDEAINYLEKH